MNSYGKVVKGGAVSSAQGSQEGVLKESRRASRNKDCRGWGRSWAACGAGEWPGGYAGGGPGPAVRGGGPPPAPPGRVSGMGFRVTCPRPRGGPGSGEPLPQTLAPLSLAVGDPGGRDSTLEKERSCLFSLRPCLSEVRMGGGVTRRSQAEAGGREARTRGARANGDHGHVPRAGPLSGPRGTRHSPRTP